MRNNKWKQSSDAHQGVALALGEAGKVMRYVPFAELKGATHIIVDAAPTVGIVLTLSHWPQSGTPHALQADLSAQSVFHYLDS